MSKDWLGVIVQDSLHDVSVLDKVGIIETMIKELGISGKWTVHDVFVQNDDLAEVIKLLQKGLKRHWYAYLKQKGGPKIVIVFKEKVFRVSSKSGIERVKKWAFKEHNILPEVFTLDL